MRKKITVGILAAGLVLLLVLAGAGAAAAYHFTGMPGGLPVTGLPGGLPVLRLGADDKDEGKGNEAEGAVTDISGTSITLQTKAGTSVVVVTSAGTTFTREKLNAVFSDIHMGDKVEAKGTPNADGTFEATSLKIKLPEAEDKSNEAGDKGNEAEGQVTEAGGTSIVVQTKSGASVTLSISAGTTFSKDKQESSVLDVHVGDKVEAKGTPNADGTFSAASVKIKLPKIEGTVTSVTGQDISVDTKNGPQTVHSSETTTVTKEKRPSSLADVAVGVRIKAQGTLNPDGSLVATSLAIKGQETGE